MQAFSVRNITGSVNVTVWAESPLEANKFVCENISKRSGLITNQIDGRPNKFYISPVIKKEMSLIYPQENSEDKQKKIIENQENEKERTFISALNCVAFDNATPKQRALVSATLITVTDQHHIFLSNFDTGLSVTQNRGGTIVFLRDDGENQRYEEIKMPHERYSLANDKPASGAAGRIQFFEDILSVILESIRAKHAEKMLIQKQKSMFKW